MTLKEFEQAMDAFFTLFNKEKASRLTTYLYKDIMDEGGFKK